MVRKQLPVQSLLTGITLNKSDTTILTESTEQLTATITPTDASNQNVTWTSDNTTAATVDANGLVTAGVTDGTATITVTTEDGAKTDVCAVSITSTPVAVTGITLNTSSTEIEKGLTEQLIGTIAPANATNQNISWSSDNTDVATEQLVRLDL